MNERIKELAEQAGITTNFDTDYYEKDTNKWADYFSEKFAELIVSECVAQCEKNVDHEYLGWGSKLSAYNIIEHFYGTSTLPCKSPYCECDTGKCTHPGFHDARGQE